MLTDFVLTSLSVRSVTFTVDGKLNIYLPVLLHYFIKHFYYCDKAAFSAVKRAIARMNNCGVYKSHLPVCRIVSFPSYLELLNEGMTNITIFFIGGSIPIRYCHLWIAFFSILTGDHFRQYYNTIVQLDGNNYSFCAHFYYYIYLRQSQTARLSTFYSVF